MIAPLLLAIAQTAPGAGVVDNPCPPTIPVPPELAAWRAQAYAPGQKEMPPTPMATATAYRDANLAARKTDWAGLCIYRAENLKLIAEPESARRVVFMGDSITEGWAHGMPTFYTSGWINRGVSGQTTQQMLLRFPGDVLALKPRAVHIMAGTNDIAGNTGPTTLDAIEANIAAMVTLAKAARIRVVLAAVPPADAFKWAPAMKPALTIRALNERLRALAAKEGATFVDYGAVLATPAGAMKREYSFDGVHPGAEGYAAMAPLARQAIAKVVPSD